MTDIKKQATQLAIEVENLNDKITTFVFNSIATAIVKAQKDNLNEVLIELNDTLNHILRSVLNFFPKLDYNV